MANVDATQATGSASNAGAQEQAGSGHDAATTESAKGASNGGADAGESARVQNAINIGYGKAWAKAEKLWAEKEAKLRGQILGELGFSSEEEATRFRESRAQEESKRPEHERKLREYDRAIKDYQAKLAEAQKTHDTLSERWFGEYKGRLTSNIARQVNLHPEAEDDLDAFLDRSLVTPEGDAGDRLVFRDRDVEVDMSDADAVRKIVEHVQKRKPIWIRPTLGQGGGTSQPRPQNGEGRQMTAKEAREAFIRETIAAMPLIKRG